MKKLNLILTAAGFLVIAKISDAQTSPKEKQNDKAEGNSSIVVKKTDNTAEKTKLKKSATLKPIKRAEIKLDPKLIEEKK